MDYKLPKHIAIIMDGNGRWAKKRGLARIEGHKAGVESIRAIVRCCLEKGIGCLSLFAFSSENWQRPHDEVNFLMGLFVEAIGNELHQLNQYGIKMLFIGERSGLSPPLQQQMIKAEQVTRNNQQLILNIVINYGGKWDILTAAKKMAQAAVNGTVDLNCINEDDFAQFLDTGGLSEPDLFIRTSGEFRISNFFLWQLAYTELYFTEALWPEFDQHEFDSALHAFGQRKRRFGQLPLLS